jgi:2-methylcitrate dehydratase PrpD
MSTAALAERYATLSFDELPGPVVDRSHAAVLDFLGCMVAGSQLPSATAVDGLTPQLGGSGDSMTVTGGRVLPQWASLVNAVCAHGVELDDTDNSASLHPGNVVIPAVLAVAESIGATGAQATTAIVAGYDAMIRIGRAATPQAQYERGFHPTATCGVFGAAVAAGSLLGLGPQEMSWALGIAGSFASGSIEYLDNGAWTKPLQVGSAVQAGVLAAMFASRGYVGPDTILEGRFGFLHAYAGGSEDRKLAEGLAEPFAILGVSVKAFACCRYCQAPIDGLLQLVDRDGITPDMVAAIDVGLVSAGHPIVAEPREVKLNPRNRVDAQFSLPYAMAVALAHRSASLSDFGNAALEDPDVRKLMPLVSAHVEDQLDAMYPQTWPARVTVRFSGGGAAEILLTDCRGDPSRPLTWPQLRQKFTQLSQGVLGTEKAQQLADAAGRFSELEKVSELMSVFDAATTFGGSR